jgi:hypothetical protein
MTAVLKRMGWPQLGEVGAKDVERLLNDIERPKSKLSKHELYLLRSSLLAIQLDLFALDHGEKAIGVLYRSTMNPRPAAKPSPRIVEAWGAEANKVQALLETLKKEFTFTFDERTRKACGF